MRALSMLQSVAAAPYEAITIIMANIVESLAAHCELGQLQELPSTTASKQDLG